MNQDDLQKIENARNPTPGMGLALDHNGLVPLAVLAPSPVTSYVLTADTTTGQQKWSSLSTSITAAQIIAAGGVTVYDRATATVDVNTSVAETSIYTKSIAGNDMSTNRMLRLTVSGDFLFNNNTVDTLTFRIKFGGTTFYAENIIFRSTPGANRQPWHLFLLVANKAAANSQMIEGQLGPLRRADTAAATTGIGGWSYPDVANEGFVAGDLGISTLGTIDTTTAQTLDVTVQWSASSANNSWRMRYAVLELV
jgi:hypothetical protein